MSREQVRTEDDTPYQKRLSIHYDRIDLAFTDIKCMRQCGLKSPMHANVTIPACRASIYLFYCTSMQRFKYLLLGCSANTAAVGIRIKSAARPSLTLSTTQYIDGVSCLSGIDVLSILTGTGASSGVIFFVIEAFDPMLDQSLSFQQARMSTPRGWNPVAESPSWYRISSSRYEERCLGDKDSNICQVMQVPLDQ